MALFLRLLSFLNILVKNTIISYNILERKRGKIWIQIILSRNELSHLYNEQTSRRIYNDIKNKYIIEFKKLEEKFEQIL